MANATLFRSLVGALIPKATSRNEAGGPAYLRTPEQVLAQLAATGCLNATFYASAEVPGPLRLAARDPGYLTDLWGAVRRAFTDGRLSRRLKEALAFAVSVTTRSPCATCLSTLCRAP